MDDGLLVTVGFIPRERFSVAAEALSRLVEGAGVPFRLVVVDCLIPSEYRHELDQVIRDLPDVTILTSDRFLLPNQSRRLVVERSTTPYTALIENDVLLEPMWLSRLLQTIEETGADAVFPMLLEGQERHHHFDGAIGSIAIDGEPGQRRLRVQQRFTADELDRLDVAAEVELAESHAVLYRTELIRRPEMFDQRLRTNEFVDDCLTLREAKARLMIEPRVRATFMGPPPVHPAERPFYEFRWDWQHCLQSHWLLLEKWQLTYLPRHLDLQGSMGFVERRHHQYTVRGWYFYLARTRWTWPLGRLKNRILRFLHLRRPVASQASASTERMAS